MSIVFNRAVYILLSAAVVLVGPITGQLNEVCGALLPIRGYVNIMAIRDR